MEFVVHEDPFQDYRESHPQHRSEVLVDLVTSVGLRK